MISIARIFGGARKIDVAGTTVDAHLNVAKVWSVNATASSSIVRLPSASAKLGNRISGFDAFFLIGVGTHGFDVVDSAGGSVVSGVTSAQMVMLYLTSSSGIGTWKGHKK